MTSILKVDTIQDADGNNIINESGNTITVGASGDTTNIIGTLNKDGVAVANTPLFDVNLSADQTASDNTATKIQFDTENLDPDNVYDNSTNYRFTVPSGQAGKYLIYGFCTFGSDTGSGNNGGRIFIYKNGSQIASAGNTNHNANNPEKEQQSFSIVLDLAVSDYIELYLKCNVTTGSAKLYSDDDLTHADSKACRFGGYKLIG
jgi:hypothetical protein